MERDEFLKRVSAAAMVGTLPRPPEVPESLPDLDPVDLVGLFRARAQEVATVVHGPVGRHGVPRAVSGIAAGHASQTYMAWDELPTPGVTSALTGAGLDRVEHRVPEGGRIPHQTGYRTLDLGVTGADAGLAESGSLVLLHGEGRPRMASLIPEVHVAILDVDSIERTLVHWARRHPATVFESANMVIVTGPSRTADIEQQLKLGVHGPRHLHVVLFR
ncbi:MAG TPA: lactate utilization protein [Acidimicrobiia bacterium]|nr:lactate utilization protein [Acidimicrobiia bacterium]